MGVAVFILAHPFIDIPLSDHSSPRGRGREAISLHSRLFSPVAGEEGAQGQVNDRVRKENGESDAEEVESRGGSGQTSGGVVYVIHVYCVIKHTRHTLMDVKSLYSFGLYTID